MCIRDSFNSLNITNKSTKDIRKRIKMLKLHKGKKRAEEALKQIHSDGKISVNSFAKKALEYIHVEKAFTLEELFNWLQTVINAFGIYSQKFKANRGDTEDIVNYAINDFALVPIRPTDFDVLHSEIMSDLAKVMGFRSPTQGEIYFRVPGYMTTAELEIALDTLKAAFDLAQNPDSNDFDNHENNNGEHRMEVEDFPFEMQPPTREPLGDHAGSERKDPAKLHKKKTKAMKDAVKLKNKQKKESAKEPAKIDALPVGNDSDEDNNSYQSSGEEDSREPVKESAKEPAKRNVKKEPAKLRKNEKESAKIAPLQSHDDDDDENLSYNEEENQEIKELEELMKQREQERECEMAAAQDKLSDEEPASDEDEEEFDKKDTILNETEREVEDQDVLARVDEMKITCSPTLPISTPFEASDLLRANGKYSRSASITNKRNSHIDPTEPTVPMGTEPTMPIDPTMEIKEIEGESEETGKLSVVTEEDDDGKNKRSILRIIGGSASKRKNLEDDDEDSISSRHEQVRQGFSNSLLDQLQCCLLYTSPSPRDGLLSRMPSSA
eukprot:TRINITY_DN13824_c0_g1_i3.p1 TRINITY_DN13824_c0_g1~~TRINITY_DN13824_c0_g1_i3.p1  ORF type:complete len:554 (-),score=140.57 TRINITY_DN13824_c0_g1_i3:10-1671(-)